MTVAPPVAPRDRVAKLARTAGPPEAFQKFLDASTLKERAGGRSMCTPTDVRNVQSEIVPDESSSKRTPTEESQSDTNVTPCMSSEPPARTTTGEHIETIAPSPLMTAAVPARTSAAPARMEPETRAVEFPADRKISSSVAGSSGMSFSLCHLSASVKYWGLRPQTPAFRLELDCCRAPHNAPQSGSVCAAGALHLRPE